MAGTIKISASLILILLVSAILIWLAIQRMHLNERIHSNENNDGFVVQRKSLPANVVALADHLNKIETTYSLEDFGEHLQLVGLNSEPDHWKDFNYFWSIPKQSGQVDSYSLTASLRSMKNGQTLTIRDAKIRRNGDGAILDWEIMWEMDFGAKRTALLHSGDSRLMSYKIEELECQIESIDRCSAIQAYDGDKNEVTEFFRLFRPSAVYLWPVHLSPDDFGNLKFLSLSEYGSSATTNLLVLVDDERMRIVDTLLLRECKTFWIDNPAEYPRHIGVRFSDGTDIKYELNDRGFAQQSDTVPPEKR